MTRIDPAIAASASARARQRSDDPPAGRHDRENGPGLGDSFGEGFDPRQLQDFNDRLRERAAAFERSTDRAARESAASGEEAGGSQPRLLATADAIPAPLPIESEIAGGSLPAERSEAVQEICARIERALSADAAPASGEPFEFRLPFDAELDGLRSVTISLSSTSLEITFSRTDAGLSPDLIAAAQFLAERLQSRFQKRRVCVFDTFEPADAQEGSGCMAALSSLLGRRSG